MPVLIAAAILLLRPWSLLAVLAILAVTNSRHAILRLLMRKRVYQIGWCLFQLAVGAIAFHAGDGMNPPAAPGARILFAMLVAVLASGLLSWLLLLFRRALGRETVEDRHRREWRGPDGTLGRALRAAGKIR